MSGVVPNKLPATTTEVIHIIDPRENQDAIPVMCWYDAMFLYEADKTKGDPHKKIKEVYNGFREQYKVSENFPLRNFGLTMMLAYGLFVFPKEIDSSIDWSKFSFKTKTCFNFVVDEIGAQNKTKQFVIGMRNAIAHANVKYLGGVSKDYEEGCEFWSVDLCANSVIFKVRTSEKCFLKFLDEIGKFVINDNILPRYR